MSNEVTYNLKFRNENDIVEGQPKPKFKMAGLLVSRNNQYGPFLVSKDAQDGQPVYVINDVKEKKHDKYPDRWLKVKAPGTEDYKIICGLFKKKYDDGSIAYTGKDRETNIKYGIWENK